VHHRPPRYRHRGRSRTSRRVPAGTGPRSTPDVPLPGGRDAQIGLSAALRSALQARGSRVQIVVDAWCNTLEDIELFVAARAADVIHAKTPDLGGVNHTTEALLHVRRADLAAYCGGTCNETERSAQVTAHIAMARGAAQVLAKPGMGVDEGMMIVGNEMARVAAGRPAAVGPATSSAV
jgi:methylaspartate ammonia-lyase